VNRFDKLELTGELVTTVSRKDNAREEIFEVHRWQPRYRQMVLESATNSTRRSAR